MKDDALATVEGLRPIKLFGEKFVLHSCGLSVNGRPKIADWGALGILLANMTQGLPFAVGDWLNYGEDRYGEKASQFIDSNNWTAETVRTYRWVASRVAMGIRRSDLSFKHHQIIAKLDPELQCKWLKLAADGEWTAARLSQALKAGEDLPIVGFFLIVTCNSGEDREALSKELEGKGFGCKNSDKRGGGE